MKEKIYIQEIDSPIGRLLIGAIDGKLCLCDMKCNKHLERNLNRIKRCLKAEFVEHGCLEGRKTEFSERRQIAEEVIEERKTKAVGVLFKARQELEEYFAGTRNTFDIPLLPSGTDFQKSVWQALLSIPYGKTVSYMHIAKLIGNPKGVRAVAQAIGSNALCILIPCHRVIGTNGSLTGFAGGLDAKKILLKTEGIKV